MYCENLKIFTLQKYILAYFSNLYQDFCSDILIGGHGYIEPTVCFIVLIRL